MSIDDLLQAIMGRPDAMKKGGITEQTGLPAGLAQSAITLVMGKLLAGGQAAVSADTVATGAARAEPGGIESETGGAGAEAPAASLGDLLERMRSQGTVAEAALHATGLPQELSAKAGIDLSQAVKAIQAILGLLAGKKATSSPKRRKTANTKSATKPKAKAKAKTSTKPKAAAKAKAKPKTAIKAKTTAKPKAKTKPKTTAKPKAEPKTKAKTKSNN